MRNKKTVRIVAIVLALLMVFSVLFAAIDALTASAVTQAQINALKDKKTELNKKKQEAQSRINTLEYEQMTALAKKQVLDERMELTEEDIENLTELIATYEYLIEEKAIEVVEAQNREDEQWETYKERMRMMEENGIIRYVAIIFDAVSFSDLLARIDCVDDIMKSDEQVFYQLQDAKLATIAAKEDLEQTKIEQEAEKLLLEEKHVELQDQLAQSMQLIAELEATLEESNALYSELSEQEAKVQKEINAKVEELKRQEAAGKAGTVGTGSLSWPCPSSNYVTSKFGMRKHPIYGTMRSHTGIDIAAGYGAAAIAADSGTVITSSYDSGYGNYVVINHGSGITTLYAHLSSRKVKVGDSVSKGQTIGLVGSTGASTGPHLHFEVSVNGSRVNPLNYFTGYSVSAGA